MKKTLSVLLALVMILSLSTVAFAASQDATFKKNYQITNAGTMNPAETFTFTFAFDHMTDNNKTVTPPAIPEATVSYGYGEATKDGLEKELTVALSSVEWPDVGIYYYKMRETQGNTAGVEYDTHEAWLKVTVAVDETTGRFYVAFVTANLIDKDGNGNTSVKTDTFTNIYSAGELDITKTVAGNMGDKGTYFEVYVTLTGEDGKSYLESYPLTGGSNSENPANVKVGEKTTLLLKHGETLRIKNLPYGVTYLVEEKDYSADGYETAITGGAGTMDAAAKTAAITNTKSVGVDTGIVLDSLPYVLLLAVACVGLFALISKKRMSRED